MNFLYIDPGTGSMLFSLAIGVATTLVFAARALLVRLRFILSGGKAAKIAANKIPYLIFTDHKRYWNVFKPICDEFEKRKIPLVYYTQSPDDPVLTEKYEFVKAEFIGEGNKGFVKMNMLNAGIVLSTTPGLDVLQWKRSKDVDWYVHIPHSLGDMSGYRMFALDHYDALLANGQNQIDMAREIESLRPAINKKDMQIVGSTYMDSNLKRVNELQKNIVHGKDIVVLVAPSWGRNGLLSKYGEKFLDSIVKTGFKIIVRPHPQTLVTEQDVLKPLQEKYTDNVEWNFENDNLAVLDRADILISDFSGIMTEYAVLFDRPVLYLSAAFDSATYDAAWIEHETWNYSSVKRYGIELVESDFPCLKEKIQDAIESKEIRSAIQEVKNECWQNIGKAVETIVDYMLEKQERKSA